jgi:two-component system, chemotaxis family, CheB/CheR fusion protein
MQGLSTPYVAFSKLTPLLFTTDEVEDYLEGLPSSEEMSVRAGRRLRVLVVDDAADVLEMFGMMLRLSGYDVAVAVSAPEALEQALDVQFDVIVSDIGMPEMNGYELARRLRALPNYRNVPLIAVSGFARYDDREQALASGFNAHLPKPVNPTTLLDMIEQLHDTQG